ncbi:tetratricopeptide repeat protein [Pelotomaculum propionicicum]|uniref:Lipopolysaccharide assembly protein B n=1 Tax=Pelotomaculum propionicicum TaxID=258475 RepID=A0A4Y7RKM6_9FIRM|nr:tetratricopeptide repeat protein [Pelotomaculum propionicicum]NLI13767.1 tetratricopeptide repeat protein [Peptococcaceae bacterium]TEB09403.1 hypothetical protein Pmgp_03174 [Pelotomaculum propionicicum]
MEDAIRLYYKGEIFEAEKILEGIIAEEPDNINAQIRLAAIKMELRDFAAAGRIYLGLYAFYEQAGNYEECLGFLEKALPCLSQAEITPLRGRCLFHLGRYQEALSDLIVSPPERGNLFYTGKCFFFLGQYNNALRLFREVFNNASDKGELLRSHYWIGRCLYSLGEVEDAVSCFEAYIAACPKEKQVYLDLAMCCLDAGLLEKANSYLMKFKKFGGSEDVTNLYLGIICYKQGDYRKSLDWLDKTTLAAQSLHWKGLACYELARYEDALDNFTAAVKYEAKPLYLKMMGNANLKLSRFFEAKICYEKALALDPSDEDTERLLSLSDHLLKTEAPFKR